MRLVLSEGHGARIRSAPVIVAVGESDVFARPVESVLVRDGMSVETRGLSSDDVSGAAARDPEIIFTFDRRCKEARGRKRAMDTDTRRRSEATA